MTEKPRVLVFSAHAADFCSRSGGTIAKYAAAGSPVRVVSLSYGEKGENGLWRSDPTLDPARDMARIKELRREEASAAAQVLGAEVRFMDWGDYPLFIGQDQFMMLVDEIRDMRPDLLLTHWTGDPLNQDHQETARAVVRACSVAAATGLVRAQPPTRRPAIFYFEASVPFTELNGFAPDVLIDITTTFERKVEALRCFHRTQPELVERYTRYAIQRGDQARSFSGNPRIRYAEGFRRFAPFVGEWLG